MSEWESKQAFGFKTPELGPGEHTFVLESEAEELADEVERLREAIGLLLESEGWGDDAADEWWRDKLREALKASDGGGSVPAT